MKHLRVQPHPACCGIYNVTYFGFATTNQGSLGSRPLNELDEDLAECEKLVPCGMLLATINEEQIPHVEFLLEKHGWKPIVKDFGGNHGKKTTLYCKVLKNEKTTEVGELKFRGKAERISNEVPGKTPVKPAPKPITTKAPQNLTATEVNFRNVYYGTISSSTARPRRPIGW